MSLTADLTEESIAELVHAFYRKVRRDAVLGPVFDGVIAEDRWPAHLATMCRFWSSVMLTSGRYSGDPLGKHRAIGAIEEPMFARWLALFEATAAELFVPEIAEEFGLKANRIARSLAIGIFQRLPERRPRVAAA